MNALLELTAVIRMPSVQTQLDLSCALAKKDFQEMAISSVKVRAQL